MKAISILSSGVLGLSFLLVACGGDDQKSASDTGKAIEAALAGIEKKFGKGSIMRLGEREVSDIPAILGSLDFVMGECDR